jgi:t-SNARE complex subunit (syntaxin)
MADWQETQPEKEARWTSQRAARDTQEKAYQVARARTRRRNWLIVVLVVIIVAIVIAAIMEL